MNMLWIYSHTNYLHIHLPGNLSNDFFASDCDLTIKQWSSEFSAENHMISEHRDRMAVMTQAPAFVFLYISDFIRLHFTWLRRIILDTQRVDSFIFLDGLPK